MRTIFMVACLLGGASAFAYTKPAVQIVAANCARKFSTLTVNQDGREVDFAIANRVCAEFEKNYAYDLQCSQITANLTVVDVPRWFGVTAEPKIAEITDVTLVTKAAVRINGVRYRCM